MKKKVILEVVWWIATIIIVALFLLPIYTSVGAKYMFFVPNVFFIVLFVTYTRYMFLMKHTWLADNKWAKVVLVFVSIPLFFYASDALFNFQDFVDRDDHISMLNHLSPDRAMEVSKYIKYQFLFFGTGGMMVIFMFPVRLIISIWRKLNRGTV